MAAPNHGLRQRSAEVLPGQRLPVLRSPHLFAVFTGGAILALKGINVEGLVAFVAQDLVVFL